MKTFRPIHWSTLLLLLLAACGGDSVPDFKGDTVEVRVFSSLNAAASALSVQGVPFDPETGESGISFALVDVFSGDTQLLFEEGRVVSEGGGPIVLNPDSNEETVFLPEGRYRFALRAFGAQSDDNVIALGEVEQQIGQDSRVTIPVTSLIGSARFEVPESVDANEVFDAFLKVSPPGRPDLEVPLGDYSVTYDVAEPSVKLAGESKLGVRVAAACAVVEVTATVDNDLSEEVSATTNVPVSSEACDNSTDVGTDLVPPFVSIASPIDGTTVGTSFTLRGDVSDQQSRVERVEVYEGTLKLGEAEIDADEMAWFFNTSLEEGNYTLTAIAFDKAGNTSRKEITLTVQEGSDGEGGQGECKSPVQIPDDALRDAIRSELSKLNSELTCEDLASLSELSYGGDALFGESIGNLEGLQYAVNLKRLSLASVFTDDYSPIANLTRLEQLTLFETNVTDLSFLANLTDLVGLEISSFIFRSKVADLTPLQNLTKLEKLDLSSSYDRDLGQIKDISPLRGLVNLTELNLLDQPVRDISPLVENSGLSEGDKVLLGASPDLKFGCPSEAYRADVAVLRERGVEVRFSDPEDCNTDGGNGNGDQVVEIPDAALERLIREAINKSEGELTSEDLASLTELSYLGDLTGSTIESLEGLQYAVNLKRLSFSEISPDSYSPIANLTKLETLDLEDSSRGDLSFLTNLTNLVELNLGSYLFGNRIEDITPLQNLKKLEKLNLAGFYEIALPSGDIEDISPLEGLTNLTELDLGGQPVTDLSPLITNSGLGEGDKIILGGAQGGGLDDICYDETYRADVEALRERGVDVDTNFDDYPTCKSEPDSDGNITVTSTSSAASLNNECTLRAAITAANTDQAVGGCHAGNGVDVIQLAENTTYTLTESDTRGTGGGNALPKITSDITLLGEGSTLQPGENPERFDLFRVFQIEASGTLTLEAVTVIGESGTSIDGLAIYNAGTTVLRNSKVADGSCEGDGFCRGGGVFNLGTLRLFGSEVSGNFVYNGGGGGIYNEGGEVAIVNSVVTGNGTVDGGRGGNIYNASGNVRVERSIISEGGTYSAGGGVYNAGSLDIVNSLLVDNIAQEISAEAEAIGTGSALFNTGKATVSFSTFVGPEEFLATEGEDGSTIDNRGELILEATLISSQADYPSCTGSLTSRGYNLNSDDTCGLTQRSDITNTAPLLGGNSVPASESPVVDAVPTDACNVDTDQRGVSRPQGSACDIGAFELEQ